MRSAVDDRRTTRRLASLLALALGVGLAACSDDASSGSNDVASDTQDDTPDSEDAETSDLPEGPVRELITVGLLGDTPLDNLVVDPNFTPPVAAFDVVTDAWQFFDLDGNPPIVRVRHWPRTPTHQPVLMLPGSPINARPAAALGDVRGVAGALSVSVWLGRDEADANQDLGVAVDFVGFDVGAGGDLQWSLEPEPSSVMTLDGIVWERYSVAVANGPAGIAVLVLGDTSGRNLYLTGPVVDATGSAAALDARRVRPGHALDAHVRDLLRHRRALRERARFLRPPQR